MHLKTVKVRNPKVTLIQIPVHMAEKWNLQLNDSVEVYESDDEKSLIIKPRQGYIEVHVRSRLNENCERLANNPDVLEVH